MAAEKKPGKIGRNQQCPCGSGKKFKRCHGMSGSGQRRAQPVFTLTNHFDGTSVDINFATPPDVIFDTSVWRSLTRDQMERIRQLQMHMPFKVFYSIVNYLELISHLGAEKFELVRSWFRKMRTLCGANVMPGPEWQYLQGIGLERYVDPAWILDGKQLTELVGGLASVGSVGELVDWEKEVEHYRRLRAHDEKSFQEAMASLRQLLNGRQIEDCLPEANAWFITGLANFFLLIRPSRNKVNFGLLGKHEQDVFRASFTHGAGMLFHAHCSAILARTFRQGRTIDPNDLNDMLQLLLVKDLRLFVTSEKLFRAYPTLDPLVQKVISLEEFLNAEVVS